ncbi:hypothetical protein ACFPPD_24355 [Cohnella suwonensis]|uniref:Uncharacterized protein n=1 Tax=Cohnella suwonensis TaxID=696072 RepID=A0ABW0M1D3_9BACL
MQKLRIGTLVAGGDALTVIPPILPHGFECFTLTFWQTIGNMDLPETAKRLNEMLAEKDERFPASPSLGTR